MEADLEFIEWVNQEELLLNQEGEDMAEKKERKPRTTKAKVNENTKQLLEALKFVSIAQKRIGEDYQTYCLLRNHFAIAVTREVIIATPIQDDIDASPHTYTLMDALSSCKKEIAISQLSKFDLMVKSSNFLAQIKCIDFEYTDYMTMPDDLRWPIDNSIVNAFKSIGDIVDEKSEVAAFSHVLLQANSAVATNGTSLIEYWHGVQLPPNMMIPKLAIKAMVKSGKDLIGFGWTGGTITFHFSDGSWIKTVLSGEKFVNYLPVVNDLSPYENCVEIPSNFFEGIKAIEPLSKDGNVYLTSTGICTDNNTMFEIEGLPDDLGFNIKQLLQLENIIKSVNYNVSNNQLDFYGENIRGIIKGVEII